ncbi:MAG: hypothetical protein C7B46_03710 [Sulfobacillus benefaciens]|uniref:Uncharacterized protein n=1 Tax=Sulfobacillus benefaciens TaxID=453960 RepID=A0A2T2XK01_9FIRM|nr:MAG: hypothetical protein C7B46_03710 [Sulfobacillus benefaciens]
MDKRKVKRPVRNHALNLYETDADELFHRQGYLVIDSSLGVMRDDPDPSPGPQVASPIDK